MQQSRFEPMGLGVGTLLNNRYELLRKLGSGGMSVVFEASDKALSNEMVALKVFSPSLLADRALVDRFHNEVIITRKLTHPNIVRTFEFGQMEKGGYFMTMEYVRGVTLDQIIQQNALQERPSFAEVVRILLEICKGMAYAHSLGVVHRDLKPANILLSDTGQVKIADFGLARALLISDKQITQAGECVGTPFYMAPEQIQEQGADHRADIYSIGIIAYEMVTGNPPFQDDSWFQLASKIIRDPLPDFPKKIRPPAWFREFIAISASKNPADRFPNVDAMIQLLEQHCNTTSTYAIDTYRGTGAQKAQAIKEISAADPRFVTRKNPVGIHFRPKTGWAIFIMSLSVAVLGVLILVIYTERAASKVKQELDQRGVTADSAVKVVDGVVTLLKFSVENHKEIQKVAEQKKEEQIIKQVLSEAPDSPTTAAPIDPTGVTPPPDAPRYIDIGPMTEKRR